MKASESLSPKSVVRLRVALIFLACVYPLYSEVVKAQIPGAWDELSARLVISAILATCATLTFVSSYFYRNAMTLMHICMYALTTHLFIILYYNNISFIMGWGLTVSLALVVPFLFTIRSRVILLFIIIIGCLCMFKVENPQIPPGVLLMMNGSLGCYFLFEAYLRSRAIHEKEMAQQRMIEMAKLSSLGEMAGGMAHEINNPLQIILTSTHLIQNDIEKGKSPEESLACSVYIKKIENSVDRIAKIISALRSYARDGSADKFEVIKLMDVIQDALHVTEAKYGQHHIKVIMKDLDAEISCKIQRSQVQQALVNLLINSADSIRGQHERWVEFQLQPVGDMINLSIMDSGKAIPADVAEKMMQPFFTTKPIGSGTGLGLSIVHGIMQAQGGNIRYDANSPHPRFVLSFPVFNIKNAEPLKKMELKTS